MNVAAWKFEAADFKHLGPLHSGFRDAADMLYKYRIEQEEAAAIRLLSRHAPVDLIHTAIVDPHELVKLKEFLKVKGLEFVCPSWNSEDRNVIICYRSRIEIDREAISYDHPRPA